LAIGVMAILVVLILPLPAPLLDMSLAISIILSVLILMTALFIQAPLEFSAFPTVLLIATMLRLALNLASTRLILGRGRGGPAAGARPPHAAKAAAPAEEPSGRRSRPTTPRSGSALRCCRSSTPPTAATASPSRSRRCGARLQSRWDS